MLTSELSCHRPAWLSGYTWNVQHNKYKVDKAYEDPVTGKALSTPNFGTYDCNPARAVFRTESRFAVSHSMERPLSCFSSFRVFAAVLHFAISHFAFRNPRAFRTPHFATFAHFALRVSQRSRISHMSFRNRTYVSAHPHAHDAYFCSLYCTVYLIWIAVCTQRTSALYLQVTASLYSSDLEYRQV